MSNFNKETVRLKSFDIAKQKTITISYELLARTGFYFDGTNSVCFFCNFIFTNWTDNIKEMMKIHKQKNPKCKLMHRKPTNNIPIDKIKLDLMLPVLVYDECGSGYRSNNILNYPIFCSKMKNCTDRLNTFKNIWPKNESINPKDLADAGFYYTKVNDRVICYSCGLCLFNWEKDDNVWIEHVKHNNNNICQFVEFRMGCDFIKNVKQTYFVVNNELNLMKKTIVNVIDENKENYCLTSNCNNLQDIQLLPCNHGFYCSKCAINYDSCQFCNEHITAIIRFFFE